MRKYALQKAARRQQHGSFISGLTDAAGDAGLQGVCGGSDGFLQPAGNTVGFPEQLARDLSNSGSHTLLYNEISPQGEVLRRQTYDYTT